MPSDFDVFTRVVIPLFTFALGVIVTFLIQRYWRTTDVVAQSAKALADLTAEWYNQLDELRRSIDTAAEPSRAARLVDDYIRNRLILPQVLYHLAVLRERNAQAELVAGVEAFLSSVTTYGFIVSPQTVDCRDIVRGSRNHAGEPIGFDSVLRILDEHQQAVAREAARVAR